MAEVQDQLSEQPVQNEDFDGELIQQDVLSRDQGACAETKSALQC